MARKGLLPILLSLVDSTVSVRQISILQSISSEHADNLLCQVIRSGECFVAVRTRVGPLLGVCSHVSASFMLVGGYRNNGFEAPADPFRNPNQLRSS